MKTSSSRRLVLSFIVSLLAPAGFAALAGCSEAGSPGLAEVTFAKAAPDADGGAGNGGAGNGGAGNGGAGNGGAGNGGAGNGGSAGNTGSSGNAGNAGDAGTAGTAQAAPPITIDPRRTLVATEQSILARFSLARVMSALADGSGVAGLTGTTLFQQLWDTQNPAPGLFAGPHCDDELDAITGAPRLGGFPYQCRPAPAEGGEASCDPFAAGSACTYVPIGLFNRFDLAPADGAHCGEYRIVYARASGIATTTERNLVIFEAMMPNPHPVQGLAGCRRVADFWSDLSREASTSARADALEAFYFDGLANLEPVVDFTHFGDNPLGAGQLRTNQFLQTDALVRSWSLREFKLRRTCTDGVCTSMRFVPVVNKTNPWGGLFDPASTHPLASAFRTHVVDQVANLVPSGTLTSFTFEVPESFDSALSQASGSVDTNYVAYFGAGASDFRSSLTNALGTSGLTPDDLVRRAQALSCAGCHRLSNGASLGAGLVWPSSLGFTHVTERATEVVGGETRYLLSDALVNAFLPHRKEVFEDYLNARPLHPRSPHAPIGGLSTH